VSLIGEAATIDEALTLIRKNNPDLVFLDVEMPFGNAFDLLDRVGNRTFETVFVTAYHHYAMDALNHHASYYLMKPVSIDELIKAVDYVRDIKLKENSLREHVVPIKMPAMRGRITIPQQNGFEVLPTDAILYCKADDNYTEICLGHKTILVSKTLKYFEEVLAEYPFVRIHKSYLVNVHAVTHYKKGKGGSVVMANGKELSVSASRKRELLSYFE
ncbi:MAG: response regulator transcription factor, partial [Sinomicrobium sp.]|nr:response regulator transcription factor [Sinomicrobium sp.]